MKTNAMQVDESSVPAKGPHKIREMRIEVHRGPKNEVTGHTVHHHMMPSRTKSSPSGAFMENTEHSFPFDANGESKSHGHMLDHIADHLKLGEPEGGESEAGEEPEGEEEEAGEGE